MTDLSSPTATRAVQTPLAPATSTPGASAPALPPAVGPAPSVPSPAPARSGHPYGVLLRARGRRAVYDIVVYQDALLLSRASGPDPALIGAVVGALLASVVGAIVGAFIGEHVARSGASKRAHELLYAAPEYVFGRDRRNLFIRSADVRYARFRAYGTHQRVLDLRLRDGSRCHMRFDVRLQSNSFATEALRISLGPRMRVEHHGFRGASLLPGALVGVIALLSAWFVAAVVFGIAP